MAGPGSCHTRGAGLPRRWGGGGGGPARGPRVRLGGEGGGDRGRRWGGGRAEAGGRGGAPRSQEPAGVRRIHPWGPPSPVVTCCMEMVLHKWHVRCYSLQHPWEHCQPPRCPPTWHCQAGNGDGTAQGRVFVKV